MRQAGKRLGMVSGLLVLAVGVAVSADRVWISDDGDELEVGPHAIFLDSEGESFDLSELEDGETRLFGSGEEQLTARRDGDTVTLERPAVGNEGALRVECRIARDRCRVLTFEDDSRRVAVMVEKSRGGDSGTLTLDEEILAGPDGETTIVIRQVGVGACEQADEADCLAQRAQILGGDLRTEVVSIELLDEADPESHGSLWIHTGGPTGMHADGAEVHDLSELYDGETRLFGYGERQITAQRQGDEVRLFRPAGADVEEISTTCTLGRDRCEVLTYEDDPERVVLLMRKQVVCTEDDADCEAGLLGLGLEHGESGHALRSIVVIRGEQED
jgi:hypothetical protein